MSISNYTINDYLGCVRLLMNNSGGIAKKYDYEPFGAVINYDSPDRLSFINKKRITKAA